MLLLKNNNGIICMGKTIDPRENQNSFGLKAEFGDSLVAADFSLHHLLSSGRCRC